MRDWRNEPRSCAYGGFPVLTPEEEAAWDEHEAYLVGLGKHDRSAYLEHKSHELNVAICNAIINEPWED